MLVVVVLWQGLWLGLRFWWSRILFSLDSLAHMQRKTESLAEHVHELEHFRKEYDQLQIQYSNLQVTAGEKVLPHVPDGSVSSEVPCACVICRLFPRIFGRWLNLPQDF